MQHGNPNKMGGSAADDVRYRFTASRLMAVGLCAARRAPRARQRRPRIGAVRCPSEDWCRSMQVPNVSTVLLSNEMVHLWQEEHGVFGGALAPVPAWRWRDAAHCGNRTFPRMLADYAALVAVGCAED